MTDQVDDPQQRAESPSLLVVHVAFCISIAAMIVLPLIWGGLGTLAAVAVFSICHYLYSDQLTEWVRSILYANILLSLIAICSGYLEYRFLTGYQDGIYASQEVTAALGEANDQRQVLVSEIRGIVFLISGFLVLKWIYRANVRARRLGAEGMKFTAGWAVGYYFIPIFFLWRPYQSMKEIWQASQNPDDWKSARHSPIIDVWWALSLLILFTPGLSSTSLENRQTIADLIQINLTVQVYQVILISMLLALLYIVNRIEQMQVGQLAMVENQRDEGHLSAHELSSSELS